MAQAPWSGVRCRTYCTRIGAPSSNWNIESTAGGGSRGAQVSEWSGVEWSGVEWSGVEWSGVAWSGVEWSQESTAGGGSAGADVKSSQAKPSQANSSHRGRLVDPKEHRCQGHSEDRGHKHMPSGGGPGSMCPRKRAATHAKSLRAPASHPRWDQCWAAAGAPRHHTAPDCPFLSRRPAHVAVRWPLRSAAVERRGLRCTLQGHPSQSAGPYSVDESSDTDCRSADAPCDREGGLRVPCFFHDRGGRAEL